MDTTADFGTGLRAHLGLEPALGDALADEPPAPATAIAAPPALAPAADADLDALLALEAELLERERAVAAREAALAARAGALLAEAQALYDVVALPGTAQNELARRRALRAG